MNAKPTRRWYLVRFANVRHNDIREARVRAASPDEALARIRRACADNRGLTAE